MIPRNAHLNNIYIVINKHIYIYIIIYIYLIVIINSISYNIMVLLSSHIVSTNAFVYIHCHYYMSQGGR